MPKKRGLNLREPAAHALLDCSGAQITWEGSDDIANGPSGEGTSLFEANVFARPPNFKIPDTDTNTWVDACVWSPNAAQIPEPRVFSGNVRLRGDSGWGMDDWTRSTLFLSSDYGWLSTTTINRDTDVDADRYVLYYTPKRKVSQGPATKLVRYTDKRLAQFKYCIDFIEHRMVQRHELAKTGFGARPERMAHDYYHVMAFRHAMHDAYDKLKAFPLSVDDVILTVGVLQRSILACEAWCLYLDLEEKCRSRPIHVPVDVWNGMRGVFVWDTQAAARYYHKGIPVWVVEKWPIQRKMQIREVVSFVQRGPDIVTGDADPPYPTIGRGIRNRGMLAAQLEFERAQLHKSANLLLRSEEEETESRGVAQWELDEVHDPHDNLLAIRIHPRGDWDLTRVIREAMAVAKARQDTWDEMDTPSPPTNSPQVGDTFEFRGPTPTPEEPLGSYDMVPAPSIAVADAEQVQVNVVHMDKTWGGKEPEKPLKGDRSHSGASPAGSSAVVGGGAACKRKAVDAGAQEADDPEKRPRGPFPARVNVKARGDRFKIKDHGPFIVPVHAHMPAVIPVWTEAIRKLEMLEHTVDPEKRLQVPRKHWPWPPLHIFTNQNGTRFDELTGNFIALQRALVDRQLTARTKYDREARLTGVEWLLAHAWKNILMPKKLRNQTGLPVILPFYGHEAEVSADPKQPRTQPPMITQWVLYDVMENGFRQELIMLEHTLLMRIPEHKVDIGADLERERLLEGCFPGNQTLLMSRPSSTAGIGSPFWQERLPHVHSLGKLMLHWERSPHMPRLRDVPFAELERSWRKYELYEKDVVNFYTQAFFREFVRPPTVPPSVPADPTDPHPYLPSQCID